MLQENRLLGLAYLDVFDLLNYALLALMFVGVFAVLGRHRKGPVAVAAVFGFLGTAVYFAANTAFSMPALSEQYAAAADEAQRSMLPAAGRALPAVSRFSHPGVHPGAGGFSSLLLVALAGVITSVVMLQRPLFSRATAVVGMAAGGLDLAYCFVYAFVPQIDNQLQAVFFIPAAGLMLMVWHIMVGWRLLRMGRGINGV